MNVKFEIFLFSSTNSIIGTTTRSIIVMNSKDHITIHWKKFNPSSNFPQLNTLGPSSGSNKELRTASNGPILIIFQLNYHLFWHLKNIHPISSECGEFLDLIVYELNHPKTLWHPLQCILYCKKWPHQPFTTRITTMESIVNFQQHRHEWKTIIVNH
jgi:hypothetical protein